MQPFQLKFIEEATDLFASLERSLLQLANKKGGKKNVEEVFRVMHTLKGNSSMFGYDNIFSLTHHLESIYDLIRSGSQEVTSDLIDFTLNCLDHLKDLLQDDSMKQKKVREKHGQLLESVNRFLTNGGTGLENSNAAKEVKNPAEGIKTYYILFRPLANIFQNGTNPLYLLEDLHALGQCKVTAHTKNIPDLEEIDPATCYTYWDVYLATKEEAAAIKDVFMFAEDLCSLEIHKVADENLLIEEKFLDHIRENSIKQQDIVIEDLQSYVNGLLQIIREKTLAEESFSPAAREQVSSTRVSNDKLDVLMNLVSELVTSQASLTLLAKNSGSAELMSVAEHMEKISQRLRDNAFNICLVPLETMTIRFQRLVRDLAGELKKEINFAPEGMETELDKTIIERLIDPILHLIRNSIDHGIESPEVREQKGKPKQGTIGLKAFHSGNKVHIELKDDGAGIDAQKVRQKAIDKKLIPSDVSLTEAQIFDLIFLPGFSTADKVSGVSGRGVGMDVVKKNIYDIGGDVEVKSQPGKGTTITIKIPLTLSILDGLLVTLGNTPLIIPLSAVEKCYEVKREELVTRFGNYLILDGNQVPYYSLRKEFEVAEEAPDFEKIVMVKYGEDVVGLGVDEIIGEHQAVLKPLGRAYKRIEFVSGASILGDGTIALVLDTMKLVKEFGNEIEA